MPFTLNPAVRASLEALTGPNPPPSVPAGDVHTRRQRAEGSWNALGSLLPIVNDVDAKDFTAKAADGHEILLRWYTKRAAQPGSAVVYVHGGGMIALQVAHYEPFVKKYVSRSGVPTLAVEYRLVPEVKAPTPVTDSYEGLKFLHAHAAELEVDPNRIGVMGDSAGGGIAASLAHHAKQQGSIVLAKQILMGPMLDDRNLHADPHTAPFAIWSADDNKMAWDALLGEGHETKEDIPPTHAAGRMTQEHAHGLPPTYIDVGELDIFREENLEYALKLGRAGVSCELHILPSMPHGFEVCAPEADLSRFTIDARIKAMQSF